MGPWFTNSSSVLEHEIGEPAPQRDITNDSHRRMASVAQSLLHRVNRVNTSVSRMTAILNPEGHECSNVTGLARHYRLARLSMIAGRLVEPISIDRRH